jgi:hypothetical protein
MGPFEKVGELFDQEFPSSLPSGLDDNSTFYRRTDGGSSWGGNAPTAHGGARSISLISVGRRPAVPLVRAVQYECAWATKERLDVCDPAKSAVAYAQAVAGFDARTTSQLLATVQAHVEPFTWYEVRVSDRPLYFSRWREARRAAFIIEADFSAREKMGIKLTDVIKVELAPAVRSSP